MQGFIHELYVLINIVHMLHELVPGYHVKGHAFIEISFRIQLPLAIVLVLSEVNIQFIIEGAYLATYEGFIVVLLGTQFIDYAILLNSADTSGIILRLTL